MWLFNVPELVCLRVLSPAAGKSTFVSLLEQENGDWEVVPEPIARWCNVQTKGSDFEVLNVAKNPIGRHIGNSFWPTSLWQNNGSRLHHSLCNSGLIFCIHRACLDS